MSTGNGQSLDPGGEGGLARLVPQHGEINFRSKCRFLEQVLAFERPDGSTILSQDQIVQLVQGLMPVVAQATLAAQHGAGDKEVRALARVWGIWIALADLQQRQKPQQHEHAHVHANLGDLIQRIEAQLEVAE